MDHNAGSLNCCDRVAFFKAIEVTLDLVCEEFEDLSEAKLLVLGTSSRDGEVVQAAAYFR